MTELVRSLMSRFPVCLPTTATVAEAARKMRDHQIGDVLVTDRGRLCGILTDRDLVVRGIAASVGSGAPIGDLASPDPRVLRPEDPLDYAVRVMREHAVRRLPVCGDEGRPVGMLSLGDVVTDRAPGSTLAAICAAPPST
ncbi:CBS domain-containing protein [Longispora sp. K20-0274]|uniref:CBS domain-containing protein n=1 Tax=Longispora sp. K20-0274 TaxID=3088255 RepID=UPI00399B66F8